MMMVLSERLVGVLWTASLFLLLQAHFVSSQQRNMTGTCRNSGYLPYNMSLAGAYDLQGAWTSYYLNYATSGAVQKNPNPATQLHFNRLESAVNIPYTSGTFVVNYTEMGPATREYSTWSDNIFVEWNFRLIAPCTGSYQFRFSGDGMIII